MIDTKQHEALRQAARLRNVCAIVRSKSYPLSDLIPLMQEAADTLERTGSENAALQQGHDAARLEIDALRMRTQADSQPALPKITADDRSFLHYNPNTDDIVKWVQHYASAAIAADRAMRAQAGAAYAELPALFREALAWGMTYGPEIPAHQWDEMRESMVKHYTDRASRGQAPDETAADILERIAEEPPINGNSFATARVLMAAQALRDQSPTTQAAPVAQGDALPREDFAWMVVQEACETEPADEDDPECIRILRRDLKSAVLAAFLREDNARAKAKEGQSYE